MFLISLPTSEPPFFSVIHWPEVQNSSALLVVSRGKVRLFRTSFPVTYSTHAQFSEFTEGDTELSQLPEEVHEARYDTTVTATYNYNIIFPCNKFSGLKTNTGVAPSKT